MTNKRREFLKQIVLGTGALASAPLLSWQKSIKDVEENTPSKKIQLSILQTTDVHCQIHPHDELFWENEQITFRKTGGYAHLSSFFKAFKKANRNTFIVDTGDMFQGSKLSVQTTGKAMLPILNNLGYDLYLPGNWEVVYYKKNMQQLMGGLQAPKICANMYHSLPNGLRGELIFQPYYIWHTQGLKIGFLGYTDHLVPIRQSPAYSEGIIYTKPEENLAHYVDVLKNQEGCNYLVMLAHLGLSQQIALANLKACQGIDIIFGGDTHERVREPIKCTYSKVVEPGAFGSFVGALNLQFEEGKVTSEEYELLEVSPKSNKADKEMLSKIEQLEAPFVASIEKIIGYSTIPLYRYFVIENPIDTLVLQALRWNMPDIDIILSNGFRFCPPRTTPDSTGNIPITQGYLFDMLPVDSTIRTGKVTGNQILKWLEKELNNVFAQKAEERFGGWVVKFEGMQVRFFAFKPNGERVESVLIGGTPLELEKIYSIAACEREGDPADMLCRFKNVKETQNKNLSLHLAIEEYLKVNSPVTPLPLKNAQALDAPEHLLTQVTGVPYNFR